MCSSLFASCAARSERDCFCSGRFRYIQNSGSWKTAFEAQRPVLTPGRAARPSVKPPRCNCIRQGPSRRASDEAPSRQSQRRPGTAHFADHTLAAKCSELHASLNACPKERVQHRRQEAAVWSGDQANLPQQFEKEPHKLSDAEPLFRRERPLTGLHEQVTEQRARSPA